MKKIAGYYRLSMEDDEVKMESNSITNQRLLIKKYVSQAIGEIEQLVVTVNEKNVPVAFMGTEKEKLEMLFVDPIERGKGIGKHLVQYGIENFSINEVTVNEQNSQAIGFYEHMGFRTYKRTDTDEQGMPYPLLYMRL